MRENVIDRVNYQKLKRYTAQQWSEDMLYHCFMPRCMPAEIQGVLLHYYQQEFYLYDELAGCYGRITLDDLREKIAFHLRMFHHGLWDVEPVNNFNQSLLNNIVLNLQVNPLVYVPSSFEMPCWLKAPGKEPVAGPMLLMQNGLLALDEALAGADDPVHQWTPKWFSTTMLPYAYEKEATCSLWLSFLDEVLEGDAERIELLQMWFGYCLTPDTSQHKFLLAVGNGANGKSVVFRILTEILGVQNVSQLSLEHFGDRFALAATVGKLANIVTEIGLLDKVAEGRIKEFVGGDRMLIDRKYKEPITIRPTARLALGTNNPPRFGDKSEGIWRRILLIPFNVEIPREKQNLLLAEQMTSELAGIFNWSLAGLRKLRACVRFPESVVCQREMAEYRMDCDPARQFLTEHYEESSYGALATRDVYNHYCQWCQANGYQPLNSANFGKSIKSVFPHVQKRYLGNGGKRSWVYTGLRHGA